MHPEEAEEPRGKRRKDWNGGTRIGRYYRRSWSGRRKERRKVGTLIVYGKQVMYRMRDDKTEVKSLVLPKTKKVAMLLASMLNYV
jgi:hypothetical protein